MPEENSPLLQLAGVGKHFDGVQALRRIDLVVCKGDITALIGPNGAGKTTLFNIITGRLHADSGTVHYRDVNLGRLSMDAIARLGVVRVFQKPRMFAQLTVRENLLAGCMARTQTSWSRAEKSVIDLLRRVGLTQDGAELAANLPFGKKRMLEIVRALATKPALLLLDEPGAGLSAEEQNQLAEFLESYAASEGLPLLFIEHSPALIRRLARKIIILNGGEKVYEGAADTPVTQQAVEQLYCGKNYGPTC